MASRGVNKCIILGNLGDDPIVRYMPNGNAVASLSVATSESWKDQQGQQQDRVEWHRVVIFGKLAEIAGEYLRKGSQVYLEGKLQTRKWQDNNGQDRYTTEVVVDMGGTMQMLGSRDQSQGQQNHSSGQQNRNNQNHNQGQNQQQRPRSNNQGGQGYAPKQRQGGNGQMQQQSQHQQQQNYTPDLDDGWDDDIPF